MAKAPIAVVSEDPLTVKLLQVVLDGAGYRALPEPSGAAALRDCAEREPSLVIVDAAASDMLGNQLLVKLRRLYAGPVIVIGDDAELDARLAAYDLGAEEYVVKPFEPLDLLARIEAIWRPTRRSASPEQHEEIRAGDASLDMRARRYQSATIAPVVLEPVEARLLALLMRQPGVVMSQSEIASAEWREPFEGAGYVLDVYIRRIRRKIERHPTQPEHLLTIPERGYVFQPG